MRRACAWVQQGAGWCHKPFSGHAGAHVGLVLAVARHPWVQHAAIWCIITHRCSLQVCITGEAFLAVLCMALSGHGRVGLLSGARQGSRLPLMGENDSAGCYAGWHVPLGWWLVATVLHECQVLLEGCPCYWTPSHCNLGAWCTQQAPSPAALPQACAGRRAPGLLAWLQQLLVLSCRGCVCLITVCLLTLHEGVC